MNEKQVYDERRPYSEWCPNCANEVKIKKMVDICPVCHERIFCCSQCTHDIMGQYNSCETCPYEEEK